MTLSNFSHLLLVYLLWWSVYFYLHSWSIFLLNKELSFFFPFSTLKKLVHCFLASIDADEKFIIIQTVIPLFEMYHFFSGCIQDFSLYICVSAIWLCWVSLYLCCLGLPEIPKPVNSDLWATLFNWAPLLLHVFFPSTHSVPTSSESLMIHEIAPQNPKTLFIFLPITCQFFSLFFTYNNFYL